MADVLTRPVRVAFEGCGHGTLNAIYSSVAESARARGWDDGVDVLIIGGDFQAVRNAADLTIMSCPAKYRRLGDFHDYYAGRRAAPCLTLFVGGNHEASSHLSELFHGGWVAPRIYYMGAAGVVNLGGVRIAGLSGIWKGHDYRRPHCERLPFGDDDVKSCYHVREVDVRRLLMVRTQVDVGLSHDWPRGVELHGDHNQLFRCKPHFRADSHDGRLGSRAAEWAMDRLRPPYWFSAHLHCKFTAIRTYDAGGSRAGAGSAGTAEDGHDMRGGRPAAKKDANPDEIELGDDDDDGGGNGGTAVGSANRGRNGGGKAVPKEANPDEIELDGDDDDDDDGGGGAALGSVVPGQRVGGQAAPKEASPAELNRGGDDDDDDNGDDGGTAAVSAENHQNTRDEATGKGEINPAETNPAETKLDEAKLDDDGGGIATGSAEHRRHNTTEEGAAANPDELELDDDHDPRSPDKEADRNPVPADLRAQLPASFARPGAQLAQQQPALAQSQAQSQAPGQPVPPAITNKQVRFLALDKCLPGRHFIQLLEIAPLAPPAADPASPAGGPLRLKYDPEWLAINRAMAPLILTPPGDRTSRPPGDLGEAHYAPLVDEARAWVDENIVRKEGGTGLTIPENFAVTAPPHRPGDPETVGEQPAEWTNPQTAAFCEMLGIPNLWDAPEEERTRRRAERPPPSSFGGRGGGRGRGGGGGGGGGGWNRGGRGGRGGGRGRGRGGGGQ